ncbi:MAG: hypothetical protein LIQ31_14685 [Planctomycetes bacterium]|nr:hypothetical protein [Planctomycetota bacterium]
MSMVITTNVAALNTTRNMNRSNSNLNSSLQKLSSGYRINSGKDGPADLVISEQLRSQINGLERAVRNTSEANNVLSIAEGALNEMNSLLKTMKTLAVHAANEGVVSTDQVEADQAEMDSAIQSLDRIANSTKYSTDQLLNGSKEINYSTNTTVKGTQNNSLIDTSNTSFQQICKTSGYKVTVSYTGTSTNVDATTGVGDADLTKQAAKAYLEIDTTDTGLSQIDENGLTQAQSFVLTGNKGSKQFSFPKGTTVSEIVSSISSYKDSTGIDASLTFNSNQAINEGTEAVAGTLDDTAIVANEILLLDNYTTNADGTTAQLITAVTGANSYAADIVYGKNTDGQGNIYIKYTGDGANHSYELYKDSSLSEESLIGRGVGTNASTECNNSGIAGLQLTFAADASYGDVAYLSYGNVALDEDDVSASDIMADGGIFDITADGLSVAAGVSLGTNTDDEGSIHFKTVVDDAGLATVYAYKDASMSADSLVAQSESGIDLTNAGSVTLNQIWNDDHTASTGLSLVLNVQNSGTDVTGTYTGSITFNNLDARIHTTEYGSDAYIQVQQLEGGLFTTYDKADDVSSASLVESGTTFRTYGQDATVNVNGQSVKTNGLNLNVSTSDLMAKIKFNEGKAGSTTIAQAGYGEGSVFTGTGTLTVTSIDDANALRGVTAYVTQACHNTRESVSNFQGGMTLQLGEGSGDQDRTVVSLQGMGIDNLGKTTVTKAFDSGSAVQETRTLTLRDVLGGGVACLEVDATLAMDIIDQAITDVSNTRAQIGALQTNMLDTNSNNLEVAIENLTLTESNIRDTDMASEMTQFTSSQILAQAGVSMLSQANSQAQNVLSLLG